MEPNSNKSSMKKLAIELRQDFGSARLFPSLTSGLVVGVVEVIIAVSFAALIFTGGISSYVANGIGFALIGAIITGLAVAIMTSIPGNVAGNQDAPAAILAVMSAAIVASMTGYATGMEIFATVLVTIALTTFLCGLFFLGLGYFKLGGLVRFLPYPVMGGFLSWLPLRH